MIEKIACQFYDHNYAGVFVQFGESEIPERIMCNEYNSEEKKCNYTDEPCIYSSWKKLK